MRKLTCLFALGFLLFNNTLRANEPEKVTSTEEVSETTAKKERIKQVTKDDDYEKFRFGGYGEMVAKFMNYGTNRFYGGVDVYKRQVYSRSVIITTSRNGTHHAQ